jgi:hypothetical protein
MTNGGQLVFGTYNGATRTITSPGTYNDGQWHQVVATQGAQGMALYVDGSQVAVNSVGTAENSTVYFRVGADSLNSWPSQPSSQGLAGSYDEAAFYSSVLSPAQIATHYTLGHP